MQMEINETWLNLFNETGIKVATGEPTDISDDTLRVDHDGAHRFASLSKLEQDLLKRSISNHASAVSNGKLAGGQSSSVDRRQDRPSDSSIIFNDNA